MRLVSSFVLGLATLPPGALSAQTPATPAQLPSVTLPAALDRVLRDYERHWRAGNADSLAALFTADGFVLQPGRLPVRGIEGITAAYRRNPGSPLELRALAFAAADTVGYIIGAFRGQREGPDAGKFILALRRIRGGPWKIVADMDNGNSRD
jgi:ketosteroid isomerase-like protein